MPRAAIGIGSNLGDSIASVDRAIEALNDVGTLLRSSSFYRTKAWGPVPQADYVNAAAIVETHLSPHELLRSLKAIEKRLGRVPSVRWGPRSIDLDILTYEGTSIDEHDLQVPHPRLQERAFVLAPLGEILEKYAGIYASLPREEQATVLEVLPRRRGETIAPMITERVRQVAEAFEQTDLVRLRIEAENEDSIELRRRRPAAGNASGSSQSPNVETVAAPPVAYDAITSDLVGIVHFRKPVPTEGEMLKGDRELAYVEALGIRNPVRSLRGGRLASILVADGDAVEYGQKLFEIDRV